MEVILWSDNQHVKDLLDNSTLCDISIAIEETSGLSFKTLLTFLNSGREEGTFCCRKFTIFLELNCSQKLNKQLLANSAAGNFSLFAESENLQSLLSMYVSV